MTVPASSRRAGPFTGNGVTSSFPFTFKVFSTADIQLVRTLTTGTEVALTTGFSVTLNGDQDNNPGGSINYLLASGEKLTIIGALPYEQPADLPTGGAFSPVVVENAIDRAVILIQQLLEQVNRGVRLPVSAANVSATLPVPEASKLLGWNTTASALVNLDTAALASVIAYGNRRTLVANGGAVDYLLDADPGGVNNTLVAVGGVVQTPGVDYTVSGTTLTPTGGPWPAGTGNVVVIYGEALPVGTQDASHVTFTPSSSYPSSSVGAVLSAWVNPVSAPFNAVAGTISTLQIQAALNAAPAGGVVVIPPSTFLLDGTLTVPDFVTLQGSGYGSLLQQTARNHNCVSLGHGSTVTNLRMQGDGVNSGGVPGGNFHLNNGVAIVGKRNARILGCWLHGFEYNGIYIADSFDYEVQNNRLWGNIYSINTGADIIVYSSTAGRGGRIVGNWCFSNNSQGIYVNALGNDSDLLVQSNICATLDPVTFAPVTSGNLLRRHGIVLGYVGGSSGGRIVCSGNHTYNTRQTGIYWQAGTGATGTVIITGNYVRDAGVNALQPALAGGIYIAAQGKADIVAYNVVDGMRQSGFVVAAGISVLPANLGVPAENNTLLAGNAIYDSDGHGVYVGSRAQNVKVADNTVVDCAQAAYIWTPDAAFTGGGTIEFSGNRLLKPKAAVQGILIDHQSSNAVVIVRDNTLVGFNNTTAAVTNSGVFIRQFNKNTQVIGNHVSTFYGGVSSDNYVNVRSTARFKSNHFANVNAAYHLGTTGSGAAITEDDVLNGSTYRSEALLLGTRCMWPGTYTFNGRVIAYDTAAPAAGTWVVGDRTQNLTPVSGQPKAWACTVAGTPGTWVSEGNL